MSSPWQVLGIAPGSSLAEVKKAYARLLRQHRPDQDPAGFRRLRDAYELAVRLVESGMAWPVQHEEEEEEEAEDVVVDGDEGRAQDLEPPRERASRHPHGQPDRGTAGDGLHTPPRPRELAEAMRRALARVRAGPHAPRELRLLRLLAALLHRRRDDFALGALALEELARAGDGLRRLLPPEVAFGTWTVDGLSLGRALLFAHLTANDLASFFDAVEAMARSLDGSAEPARLAAALDAARIVALLDPACAERLADLVFQKAPPGLRTASCDVDAYVQAGRQLRERKLREHLPGVVAALLDPRVADDDPRAHRVLEFVVTAAHAPDLAALVAERFPTAWPQYEREWRRNRANRTKRQPQPRERRGFWWYLAVAWLVLTSLGAIVRGCSDDRTPKFRFERRALDQWSSSTGLQPESPR